MISFITSAINGSQLTSDCLDGLKFSLEELGIEKAEIILIDDYSQDKDLEEVYLNFKKQSDNFQVKIYKFLQRQQYSAAVSFGFSKAQGELIGFISNDMIITPNCLNTLISVLESESDIGLVRSTSNYTDCFQNLELVPQLPLRNYLDICIFSNYVNQYYELEYVEHDLLVGDLFLIKREIINQLGYFDCRFKGYFSDIDFGIRLRKAGYKMVTAKGAWLYHLGAGHMRNSIEFQQEEEKKIAIRKKRLKQVAEDNHVFINKYNLPPREYTQTTDSLKDCEYLIAQELENFNLYIEPYQPPQDLLMEVS